MGRGVAVMPRAKVLALMLVPSCAFLAPFAPPRHMGGRMMTFPAVRPSELQLKLRRPPALIVCRATATKAAKGDDDDGFVYPDEQEEEESGDEWMNEAAWGEGPEDHVMEARLRPCDEIPLIKCTIVAKAASDEGEVKIQAFKGWELSAADRKKCFRIMKDNM